jgi:hypothetical protein
MVLVEADMVVGRLLVSPTSCPLTGVILLHGMDELVGLLDAFSNDPLLYMHLIHLIG